MALCHIKAKSLVNYYFASISVSVVVNDDNDDDDDVLSHFIFQSCVTMDTQQPLDTRIGKIFGNRCCPREGQGAL